MRIVVVSKGSGRGTGTSQATRYVSRRERNEGREGAEARRLFSAHADDLGCHRANLLLGDGTAPQTKDVLHLVLSFGHEEDFTALGEDEAARQQAVREITRATLSEMTEKLYAQELRWVAGIHHNTDHPHVHLLLQRGYTDKTTARAKRLKTLPAEWRVSWEKTAEGERQINAGGMSQTFEQKLMDRITERTAQRERSEAEKVKAERWILGRALLAQDGGERLAERKNALLQFGEYRGYEIEGANEGKQRLSVHDFQRQARRHAARLVTALPFELAAPERRALSERLQAQWFAERKNTLDQLAAAQAREAEQIATRQAKFQQQAEPILTAAQAIQEKYEKAEQQTPLPALSPAALTYLQERAIRQGDALQLTSLEEVRSQLAAEKNAAPRTEQELARLVAQKILAEARLQTERQKAAEFEANQHLYRWEIAVDHLSENAPQKISLASVERALRWENDQAKFIGARAVHWNDERRTQAQERVAELTKQRALIRQAIAERQTEFAARIERQASVVTALNAIAEREQEQRKLAGQTLPPPRFNAPEMRELEALAQRRGDPDFTRTLLQWERDYDAQTLTRNESPLAERTSRAFARVILAEITQHEVTRQQRTFLEKREHVTVLLIESGAREPTTARLADVAPRSRLERAFPSIFTQSAKQQAVVIALSVQEQRLADERQQAVQNRVLLTEAAHLYAKEFQQVFPMQPLPRPAFRPQEIERLASYLEKETDPSLQAHYEAIYQAAVRVEGRVLPERNQRDWEGEMAAVPTIEWER